ncbi:MAG: hypothetical protein M1834_006540 [Cirrosporium novae-zelandiae]|nr:MAG: hypothetical protein M1834_006540 [Cirrosporium novae-zelandiae]
MSLVSPSLAHSIPGKQDLFNPLAHDPVNISLPSDIPIAELQTIDFGRLHAGDKAEGARLLDACKSFGFFYLALPQDEKTQTMIQQMYSLIKGVHNLEDEEKMRYDVDKLSKMKLNGYKPVGRNFGGLQGNRDGFETWGIPKNGVMGFDGPDGASFARPPIIDQYMETLKAFANTVHAAAHAIFGSLSESLNLPQGEGFEDYHRTNMPSPDIIRLLKYHPQPIEERGVVHTPHTDLGSLTFLFTEQPGLQVLSPGADEWKYVAPRPGHAIINLGDMMGRLTNKYFHSCLHRVVPLPNKAMEMRYSFAYLMRAEDWTPMKGLKSDLISADDPNNEIITSGQWLQRKFGMLRLDTHKKGDDWVLTGQKNALPQ